MTSVFGKRERRRTVLRCLKKIAGYCFLLLLINEIVPSLIGAVEADNPIPFTKKTFAKGGQEEIWDRDAPVDIRSDKLNVDFDAHQIVFKGNVKVRQADFSLTAREVIASFGENADDIERIVAKGKVDIKKADKQAWGEKASYDRKQAVIILTGNPFLRQGKNILKGEEIQVLLDQDRMEVKGAVIGEFHLSEPEPDGKNNPLHKGK